MIHSGCSGFSIYVASAFTVDAIQDAIQWMLTGQAVAPSTNSLVVGVV